MPRPGVIAHLDRSNLLPAKVPRSTGAGKASINRPAVQSVVIGCDRRCRTPLGDFETPPLVTGGNGERTCRQPFAPGGTPPGPEQSGDSNIQVEPLGSHSKGQVVRGSSAVVSDGGRDVDHDPLGWVDDSPRLRVVDRLPLLEHTFDLNCYRDGRPPAVGEGSAGRWRRRSLPRRVGVLPGTINKPPTRPVLGGESNEETRIWHCPS